MQLNLPKNSKVTEGKIWAYPTGAREVREYARAIWATRHFSRARRDAYDSTVGCAIGRVLLRRLTTDSASDNPAWSTDGERIAYVKVPPDSVVMWRPLYATGQPTSLVRSKLPIVDIAMGRPHGYAADAPQTTASPLGRRGATGQRPLS